MARRQLTNPSEQVIRKSTTIRERNDVAELVGVYEFGIAHIRRL